MFVNKQYTWQPAKDYAKTAARNMTIPQQQQNVTVWRIRVQQHVGLQNAVADSSPILKPSYSICQRGEIFMSLSMYFHYKKKKTCFGEKLLVEMST